MSELRQWRAQTLGSLINLKRGYDLPSRLRNEGKYPIYSSSGISGYHNEFICNPPGVITGRYGTIGQVFHASSQYWPLNTTLYVQDFKGNDARFVFYFLQTLDWEKFSDKSAVPGVNRNDVHTEEVSFPEPPEQRAIADVLSSLDGKIDLLHRQNKTLEAMAETLFRQWFEEEASDDWEMTSFADHFDAFRGLSYRGSGLTERGLGTPMHNLNSVYEGGGYKDQGIKYYSGEFKDRHVVRPGDVIVANTEQGHKFRLIGYPAIVPSNFGEIGIFSQHIYRLVRKESSFLSNEFIYFQIMTPDVREQITSATNGSTVNMLAIDGLQRPTFRLPPKHRVDEFSVIAYQCRLKTDLNKRSIRQLEALRDTLLPKLMSGEVRVANE